MNKFKKGDSVIVISGKDRGKIGKILMVFPRLQQVSVEKVRVVKRHTKPTQQSRGGILETAGKMPWSKVKLLCPKTEKPTRISYERGKDEVFRKAKVSGELFTS